DERKRGHAPVVQKGRPPRQEGQGPRGEDPRQTGTLRGRHRGVGERGGRRGGGVRHGRGGPRQVDAQDGRAAAGGRRGGGGGSKGIGLACARTMMAEGAQVAILSRSAENVAAARVSLGGGIGITADLTDAGAALAAVEEAERVLGPIDILINSAGAAARTVP